MNHSKIAIIGTGAVGSTTAYALIMRNIAAEILLVDIDEIRCKGEILDLSDAIYFSSASSVNQASVKEAGQADIIIIAAGVPQKPGQKRIDLWNTNKTIISSIVSNMQPINPNAIIIVVSNPLDLLTLHIQKSSGLPWQQVFGTGTMLDTQRLRNLLSQKINIAEQSIHLYVLGEHGDTQFPAWSTAHIGGVPITNFPNITKKDIEMLPHTVRDRAYEIISCKGATFFGIAASVAKICENILFDQKRVVPLSCYQKEFKICLSMPVVLGRKGIEQIISVSLNKEERQLLEKSAQALQLAYNTTH